MRGAYQITAATCPGYAVTTSVIVPVAMAGSLSKEHVADPPTQLLSGFRRRPGLFFGSGFWFRFRRLAGITIGFFTGRRLIVSVRDVAPLVFLEVGFVPATALQPEGRRRDQAPQAVFLALRALHEHRLADFLQRVETMPTILAFIFINRHELTQP